MHRTVGTPLYYAPISPKRRALTKFYQGALKIYPPLLRVILLDGLILFAVVSIAVCIALI